MDRKVFAKGLKVMAAFYGWPEPLNPNKCGEYKQNRELWYEKLKNMSDRDFLRAVNALTDTEDFFPRPKKIIHLVRSLHTTDPHTAWEQVREKAHDYRAENCDDLDAITRKAVESMGGLKHLKEMNWEAGEQFIRRDFLAAYDQITAIAQHKPEALLPAQEQRRLGKASGIKDILKIS